MSHKLDEFNPEDLLFFGNNYMIDVNLFVEIVKLWWCNVGKFGIEEL